MKDNRLCIKIKMKPADFFLKKNTLNTFVSLIAQNVLRFLKNFTNFFFAIIENQEKKRNNLTDC